MSIRPRTTGVLLGSTLASGALTPPTSAPTVSENAASGITDILATLAGTVNPNGLATTYEFQWGTTTAYGTNTSPISAGSGTSPILYTANIGSLTADTTYHWQLVATNSKGVTYGPDQTFTTLTTPGGGSTYYDLTMAEAGLVAYYRFDETSGTTVNDSHGSADGVYTTSGVTLNQSGLIDNDSNAAVLLDGASGTVRLPAFNLADGPLTVEVWVNRNSLSVAGAAQRIFQMDNGVKIGFSQPTDPTPQGVFLNQGDFGVTNYSNVPIGDITSDHHIVVTKNGPTVHIYLDGIDVTVNAGTNQLGNGYQPYSWLGSNWGSAPFLGAVCDELAIYSVELSASTVLAHYLKGAALSQKAAVVASAADGITGTGATVHGTVNPNGNSTTYWFEYGTSTGYGSTTSSVAAGSGSSPLAVSSAIGGLTGGNTYHWRLAASNNGGTAYTSDQTFVTPGPPSVMANPATNLANTSVTLNGAVNPMGADTVYQFQYGTTTGYGSVAPASPADIGSGTSAVVIHADISGLVAATTYHWRLAASNANGTTYTVDNSFQTTGGSVTSTFYYMPVPAGTKFSSPNSFWYKPLPTDNSCRLGYYQGRNSFTGWYSNGRYASNYLDGSYYPQSFNEANLLANLRTQCNQGQPGSGYCFILDSDWTANIYCVPANFQMMHLMIYQYGNWNGYVPIINAAINQCPIPANEINTSGQSIPTGPGAGYDRAVSVYSASLDRLYQFNYSLYSSNQSRYPDGPFWAGYSPNISQAMGTHPNSMVIPGYNNGNPVNPRSNTMGASGSGMYVEAGMLYWEEWVNYRAFNHALYMHTNGAQPTCTYPAYKGDSGGVAASGANSPPTNNNIPHGTMFRFDPSINFSDANLAAMGVSSPFARALCRAGQTYGFIPGDGAGQTICLSAELTSRDQWNPGPRESWNGANGYGWNGGVSDSHQIMMQVWSPTMLSHMQVVDPKWLLDNGRGAQNDFPYI